MALRETRIAVRALARGSADKVRLTRIAVHALCADSNPALVRVTRIAVHALCADDRYFVDAENAFAFVEEAAPNYIFRTVSNSFDFESASGPNYEEDLIQYIGWTPRHVEDVTDQIFYAGIPSQTLSRVVTLDIENQFVLPETVIQAHNAPNDFSLVAAVAGFRAEDVFNSLDVQGFVDAADTEYERDDMQSVIKQHLTFKVTGSRCVERDYAPIVGEQPEGYDAIPLVAPTLTRDKLTLVYPASGPAESTLILKNPVFGNEEPIQFSLVEVESRGGEQIAVSDPKWPTVQTLGMRLDNLCDSLVDPLIAFINLTLGKRIKLTDWEGQVWTGIITRPETVISQVGIDRWTVTLGIEAERQ